MAKYHHASMNGYLFNLSIAKHWLLQVVLLYYKLLIKQLVSFKCGLTHADLLLVEALGNVLEEVLLVVLLHLLGQLVDVV